MTWNPRTAITLSGDCVTLPGVVLCRGTDYE